MASKSIPDNNAAMAVTRQPPANPSMKDVGPVWAERRAKLAELYAREQELLDAIHKPRGGGVAGPAEGGYRLVQEGVSLAEEGRRHSIGWVDQLPKAKVMPKERHAGAVELLGSLLPEQTPEELAPAQPRPSWPGKAELDALGEELEKVRFAIAYLTPETAKAHAEASKSFCEARRPEYAALVARMVEAVTLLGCAIIDHRNYLRDARLEGASVSFLRPVSTEQFGFVGEAGTPLLRLIDDSIEAGHVPADSRPAWKTPSRDAWSVS